jgi:hypothetical protein
LDKPKRIEYKLSFILTKLTESSHNITFKQLETVREVARQGTMVRAAEALSVTPAALTARVKLLEEEVRMQLFEGRLRLTEAGREVVAAAARIDNVTSDLFDTLVAETDCWPAAFASAWSRRQNISRPGSSRRLCRSNRRSI